MADSKVLFLPWLRQGLASRLNNAETLAASMPATTKVRITLGVTGGAGDPALDWQVRGPADVIGIDPRQVVRTEPDAGARDFEALHLAAIEFDNPDLPWMFTPAAADAQGRLRPWMCLVVVRKQDGVRLLPPQGGPLPVLDISAPANVANELPDLAESWAWAHAQIGWPSDAAPETTAVQQLLATRPELSVARLMCPRRLQAHTDYIACVVPTFEVGRCAGLNLPAPAKDDLTPAWRSGADAPARIELPVFHTWEFRTGAREDFETIVDRLAPRDLSEGVGQRPMAIDAPGFVFEGASPQPVALEGALQPVGMARLPLAESAGTAWPEALRALVNRAARTEGADPLVGPPIYGRWLAGRHEVGAPHAPTWLDEINLDPRERAAAALGTRVIQQQQDDLMADAWTQAGQLAHANQQRRQIELAGSIGGALHRHHVLPLADDAALWQLAAPAQRQMQLTAAGGQTVSMQATLAEADVPAATLAAPLRRLTRSRGPLARRSARMDEKAAEVVANPPPGLGSPRPAAGAATAASALRPATAAFARPALRSTALAVPVGRLLGSFGQRAAFERLVPAAKALVTVDDVCARVPAPAALLRWAQMTNAGVAAAPRQAEFDLTPPRFFTLATATLAAAAAGRIARPIGPRAGARPLRRGGIDAEPEPPEREPPPPRPPRPPPPRPIDSADAAAFRAAAQRHLAHVNPARPPIFFGQFIAVAELFSAQRAPMQRQLDPQPLMRARLGRLVRLGDAAVGVGNAGAVNTPGAPPAPGPAPTNGTAAAERSGALGIVPRFALPASEALARLSQDWLLPGLPNVPPDTVALLETNNRFIEAFMLGLNVEMTRELLWRDFPLAHEQGTYFERFWRGRGPDIAPIAQWGTRELGNNGAGSAGLAGAAGSAAVSAATASAPVARIGAPGSSAARPLVLLLRSDLLRRYPGTAVYAVRGTMEGGRRQPPAGAGAAADTRQPLFRGSLPPDVSFFGFALTAAEAMGNMAASDPGWYFVLQQQPTEPRFGFDHGVDTGPGEHTSLQFRPTPMSLPEAGTPWARNAAVLAQALKQFPVRVLIHASELLPGPQAEAEPTPAPNPGPGAAPPTPPAPTPPAPPSGGLSGGLSGGAAGRGGAAGKLGTGRAGLGAGSLGAIVRGRTRRPKKTPGESSGG